MRKMARNILTVVVKDSLIPIGVAYEGWLRA